MSGVALGRAVNQLLPVFTRIADALDSPTPLTTAMCPRACGWERRLVCVNPACPEDGVRPGVHAYSEPADEKVAEPTQAASNPPLKSYVAAFSQSELFELRKALRVRLLSNGSGSGRDDKAVVSALKTVDRIVGHLL